jgi:hypothetical protein
MNYENGFYIYTPTEKAIRDRNGLDLPQVIRIIKNKVYVCGSSYKFNIHYVSRIGVIGELLINKDDFYIKQ